MVYVLNVENPDIMQTDAQRNSYHKVNLKTHLKRQQKASQGWEKVKANPINPTKRPREGMHTHLFELFLTMNPTKMWNTRITKTMVLMNSSRIFTKDKFRKTDHKHDDSRYLEPNHNNSHHHNCWFMRDKLRLPVPSARGGMFILLVSVILEDAD